MEHDARGVVKRQQLEQPPTSVSTYSTRERKARKGKVRDTNGVEQKSYIGKPSSRSRPPDPCLIIAGSAFGTVDTSFEFLFFPVLLEPLVCVIDTSLSRPPDEEAVQIPVVTFRVPALNSERGCTVDRIAEEVVVEPGVELDKGFGEGAARTATAPLPCRDCETRTSGYVRDPRPSTTERTFVSRRREDEWGKPPHTYLSRVAIRFVEALRRLGGSPQE